METRTAVKIKPDIKHTLMLNSLNIEFQSIKELVEAHSHTISELQEQMSHKRRPPNTNGKIQLRDKQTGKYKPAKSD